MQLRATAWAIVLAAFITLFAIFLHPSLGGRNPAGSMTQLVAMGPMDRIVHGVVIGAEIVLLAAFAIVSAHLGLGRLPVAGGLAAYAVGVGLTVAASVIDGFITPDVAAHYAGGSPAEIDAGVSLLTFGSIALQDLTKVGIAAMSAAIVVWSLVLFEQPGRGTRPLAVFGIASSVFAVAVLASASRISPHLLLLTIAAQTLWYAGVGIAVANLRT